MTWRTPVVLALVMAVLVAADDAIKPPVASDEHAARFRADMKTMAQTDEPVVRGGDGWLFLPSELRHIGVDEFWGERAAEVSKATKPEWADPLPVIVDFHKQLKDLGVELIVVPVPPKAMIYPEKVSPTYFEKLENQYETTPRLDQVHRQIYDKLRAEGVQVADMTDAFLIMQHATEQPFYCKTDTHWSAPAISLTALGLSEMLKMRDWYKPYLENQRPELPTETRSVTINGDLRQLAEDDSIEKETLPLTFVGRKVGGELQPLENNEDSPILLLGDSHLLVFHAGGDMHAKGAGLADHLALRTGIVPEVIAVRGSGATPARINLIRKAYRDPDWLKNKKLVIWVFTAREFTETTGWRPLPLTR